MLITDRLFYKFFGLKEDDIVVAVQPVDPKVDICKRMVAVGGNQIKGGKYGINVPENSYWLEGDNKFKSYDSRNHGAVPANLIKGKVVWVIHF